MMARGRTTLLGAVVLTASITSLVMGRCQAQVLLRNAVPRLTAPVNHKASGHVSHAVPPLPRLHQSNILPDRMTSAWIPKANFTREDIRPRRIEIDTVVEDSVVWENILPGRLPRGVMGPPRLDPPALPPKISPQFDSSIFLPPLPPPSLIHGKKRDDSGWMPAPDHRRLLGW
jgi:hypothetical protein